ncbi:MAG TPA: M56 family metallopeptidase [Candidatus Aquilonibacter sp.]|nr:M56 family metallopeptidase [Candidatus Aquilonibacter sp.]
MISPALLQSHWMIPIANHLWQSTVFVLAAWLLTIALERNQARARYWLWMAASAKFLLPFSLLIAAGERVRPATPAAAVRPELLAVMNSFTQPLAAPGGAHASAAAPTAALFAGAPSVAAKWPEMLPAILITIWILGTIFLLARWGWRWWGLRRIVRAAVPLEMNGPVRVVSTPVRLEPGIFGVLRPVLLLPEGIRERLSAEQLDAVIAHELCHVRRRDNLAAALHMLVEAVFWFYPPVWWVGARLLEERERACDEAVLESRREPLAYAEGILGVCKAYMEAPLHCVSGVTGSDLKKRILRIMTNPVTHKLDLTRKLLLGLVAIFLVAAPVTVGVLHASGRQGQTAAKASGIEGTWQGTLQVQQAQLRIVIKATGSGQDLKVVMYSIDQAGGQPIPASSASFEGSTFKFAIQLIDGTYEGKVSSDGNSISGTWKQGPLSLTLVLERATPETEWTIPAPPAKVPPMAADANPSFEVATIKPSKPDQPGKAILFRGHQLTTINTTMADLIAFSYDLQQSQIVGAPKWVSSDKFDLAGEPDAAGAPSDQQLKTMVQKLLADRFQLKFHRETKEMSAYVLTVGKDGPKLQKSQADPNDLPALFFTQLGTLNVRNATMDNFAGLMQTAVFDRPVVNNTGLQGKWDFILKWTPDESQFASMGVKVPPPSDAADAPPPVFTAIQEQIGLKLEAQKAPVPVIVIDNVAQPSPN